MVNPHCCKVKNIVLKKYVMSGLTKCQTDDRIRSSKMAVKLIVHKFENDLSSKSLLVTIAERDNELSETKFGEWLDGIISQKKESEKSSRLVVKIVTGNELTEFNLDSCANLIDNLDVNSSQQLSMYDLNQFNVNVSENHLMKDEHGKGSRCFDSYQQSNGNQQSSEQYANNNGNGTNDGPNNSHSLCPLEYSLEKVKENNARIMEHIHMLNRTLNYTKKKEILDIACPKSMRSYPCETCGKCFVYETGLRRHYTIRHAINENLPRWQVVWTCIQCFQVWPKQDLALSHSRQCSKIDHVDSAREIKTSSLLQCEFCEKVFTSIPRLIWHSRMHSTLKNYECNACDTSFSSFRAAEEHWLLCPWLKTYYNFSLPKLLLCNACDRKFRNYELLYNHR